MSTEVEAVKAVVEITPLLKGVYFFANVAYTGVLIWGLKNVSSVLKGPPITEMKDGIQQETTSQRTGWHNMLASRSSNTRIVGGTIDGTQTSNHDPGLSYARVSGAIGSIAIASLFVLSLIHI